MAPGAGFEPARGRRNSAVPFQLGDPGTSLVGNLGVEPSASAIRTQRIAVFLIPGTTRPRAHWLSEASQRLATASPTNMVEEEGIEPPSAGCRPAVLPLNDSRNCDLEPEGIFETPTSALRERRSPT
jgi:hypothetical protein